MSHTSPTLQTHLPRTRLAVLGVALLVGIAVLLYCVPRNYFRYAYVEGQPWNYAPLIADFQFDIKKSPAQLQAEKEAALRTTFPYYHYTQAVQEEALAALQLSVRQGKYPHVPDHYVAHVVKMLRDVYAQGILSSADYARCLADSIRSIHIEIEQRSTLSDMERVYSEKTAYEHILLADTAQYAPNILQQLNLNQYLAPNLTLDETKTEAARKGAAENVTTSVGLVSNGERIVDRGEVVTAEIYNKLSSYEQEVNLRGDRSARWMPVLGQALFMLLVVAFFLLYIYLFRRDYFYSPHTLTLSFTMIFIFVLLTYLLRAQTFAHVFILPYAMVPMFVRILMDSRTAVMAHFSTLMLASMALADPYPFLLVEIIAGLTIIYGLKDLTERSGILRVVAWVMGLSLLTLFAYQLWTYGDWHELHTNEYEWLGISGLVLLFAYPMLYLIERMFGFTSSVTLVELANTNNPLLRRMSKEAQGTFVHSLQVSNLATDVADAIGAKPLLTRVGALYHDIGKILTPAFFTENQSGVNPHDKLSEPESAAIIIDHVRNGLRLAEKWHLPEVLRDFIRTHHGCSQAKYFAIRWQNAHPNEPFDAEPYTYPGPNPQTREQAIVMMCDAVEAASRSLQDFTEESIRALVNKIIDDQVAEGYFRECPLTFRDIETAKRTLCESLKTIYHTRIAYPERNQPKSHSGRGKLRGFKTFRH